MKNWNWLLLLFVSTMFFSCSKEKIETVSENNQTETLSLESAKTWYNSHHKNFVSSRNSEENEVYITPLYTKPIWNRGQVTTFNNSREFVVVPIEQDFKDSLGFGDYEDANLIFLKDSANQFSTKLMIFVTDSIYNSSNPNWDVSNYSGAIVVVEEDGFFSQNIFVENGKINHIIKNPLALFEETVEDYEDVVYERCGWPWSDRVRCPGFGSKKKKGISWKWFKDIFRGNNDDNDDNGDDDDNDSTNSTGNDGSSGGGNLVTPIFVFDFPDDWLWERFKEIDDIVYIYENDDDGSFPNFSDLFNNDFFTRDELQTLIFDCLYENGTDDPNEMPLIVLMEDLGPNWYDSFYLGYLFYLTDLYITTLADGLVYAEQNCSANIDTRIPECGALINEYGSLEQEKNEHIRKAILAVYNNMVGDYERSGGACADMDYLPDDALSDFEMFKENFECENAAQTFINDNGFDMSVGELEAIIGDAPSCGEAFDEFALRGLGLIGQDWVYDEEFWSNPNLTFPTQVLPTWEKFNNGFPRNENGSFMYGADNIYELVGGELLELRNTDVAQTIARGEPKNRAGTNNTCALKVSIALNNAGIVIPCIPGKTFKDKNGKCHFINAKSLSDWMKLTFPIPAYECWENSSTDVFSKINGRKGIVISTYHDGLGNETSGHADIYLGNTCSIRPNGQDCLFSGTVCFWNLN